ncbi:serine hydrolase domain-containing protein [Streptomyces sp. NPDC059568]|uniref:serine hydrolase domain-containing protein n=1 Tax=unclassified Streptomyces TaxID=2593676 RepID=UPI003664DFD5
MNGTQSWLDANFAKLVRDHGVPGATVAVRHPGGEIVTAAAGVTSTTTGVEVDTDTIFQIGSITKLWTSALVMQLVDDGLLDIDKPIKTYLPEFEVGAADATNTVTTRQLLSHTAGFEGDIFTDTGRGDDAVEKYLASIHDIPQLFAPGEVFSYNNTGFVVLGRLVEVLRGQPFDTVLMERLATPLGLTSVSPSPYEAILRRAAVGHAPDEDGKQVAVATWALTRSHAPGGAMLAMTPSDLLGFIGMHAARGVAPDGRAILTPATVAAMQEPQVEVPMLALMGGYWGLGWEIEDFDGIRAIGHDGGTIGQIAFCRWIPATGIAVALFTNGGDAVGLYRAVAGHLLKELADVLLPGGRVPPAEPTRIDPTPYLGHYADTIYDLTVTLDDDGRIWLDRQPKDVIAELGEKPLHVELVHFAGDSLIAVEASSGVHPIFAFVGRNDADLAKFVHNGRVIARAA